MKYFEIKDAKNQIMKLSKIILGGVPLGTAVSEQMSFEMMDRYIEQGGNTLDTARVYCEWIEGGKYASEGTIGKWVKERRNRNDVYIITKGGHPRFTNMDIPRMSRKDINEDIETSLKTLQMDYVDVYLLHRDDKNRPVSDIMETLHSLVKQGKTRAIGVSNWSVDRIKEANEYADRNNLSRISTSQIQWSLAECFPSTFNDETLVCMTNREYQEYLNMGLPVMAYSSQANGIFSKAGDEGLLKVSDNLQKFVTPENIKRFNNLQALCKETGYTRTTIALNYIVDNKLNSAAIIGCTKMEQLKDCLSAAGVTLTQEEIDSLIK